MARFSNGGATKIFIFIYRTAALNVVENDDNSIARNRKLQNDTKLRCDLLNGVDSAEAATPSQTTLVR